MREIYDHRAKEGDDIIAHLKALQEIWDRITLVSPEDELQFINKTFKLLLANSLPLTWDDYTQQFHLDPTKWDISIHTWIAECNKEFRYRLQHEGKTYETHYSSFAQKGNLLKRIGKEAEASDRCKYCLRTQHKSEDCWSLIKTKCKHCKKDGHLENKCRYRKKSQRKKEKHVLIAKVLSEKTEAHTIKDDEDETLNAIDGDNSMEIVEPIFDDMFDYNMNYSTSFENDTSQMYKWLADTGSTNHIAKECELFSTYEIMHNAFILGVGSKHTKIEGQGTILLIAQHGEHTQSLHLECVNHIPSNKYNIFSLGRQEKNGRSYKATQGKLTLNNWKGTPILQGLKVASNLYKFSLKRGTIQDNLTYSLSASEPTQSWEIWHRQFGHISYDSLKKLYKNNLVDSFNINTKSSMPDCVACVEGKHTKTPFPIKKDGVQRKKGELTHMDLWGKYDVTSINGHQYYLLLVDDATRYVTLYFLKTKNEAYTHIKNYMTHLHVHRVTTHSIRVDRGTEFINKDLESWCHEKGMTIEKTAPYSPSQNGIAERMNCTLVELARSMTAATKMPEFLWEPAVAHAAYLRNRAYTSSREGTTPYHAWSRQKPNASHFCEFSAPVCLLLQGQTKARKILPKSKRRAYVGYDENSKSVLYYNAQTRKILTSRNFVFLTAKIPETEGDILIKETPTCEDNRDAEQEHGEEQDVHGEKEIQPHTSKATAKKRNAVSLRAPRKRRGATPDYRRLNDPFEDDESEYEHRNLDDEDEENLLAKLLVAEIDGEFHSLKEAQASPQWPKWNAAIDTELKTLEEKGTWQLVEKPDDAIPLKNKWVFINKENKEGIVVQNKAQLVVKGCGEHPGFNYIETHSPVVRMESIRAILAIAVTKGLIIQQMDVKGAYLNGILKETIYMRQPKGFEDGTRWVCHLIKTLYSLKQAGHEWNTEFDCKM